MSRIGSAFFGGLESAAEEFVEEIQQVMKEVAGDATTELLQTPYPPNGDQFWALDSSCTDAKCDVWKPMYDAVYSGTDETMPIILLAAIIVLFGWVIMAMLQGLTSHVTQTDISKMNRRVAFVLLIGLMGWWPMWGFATEMTHTLTVNIMPTDGIGYILDQGATGAGTFAFAAVVLYTVGLAPIILFLSIFVVRYLAILLYSVGGPILLAFWALHAGPLKGMSRMAGNYLGKAPGILLMPIPVAVLLMLSQTVMEAFPSNSIGAGFAELFLTMAMFSLMAYIPLKMMDVGEVGGKVAGLATGAAAAGIAKSSYGEVTGSSSSDGDVSTGTDSVESDAEMETTSGSPASGGGESENMEEAYQDEGYGAKLKRGAETVATSPRDGIEKAAGAASDGLDRVTNDDGYFRNNRNQSRTSDAQGFNRALNRAATTANAGIAAARGGRTIAGKVSDGVSNVQERREDWEQTKVAAETKAELAEEHGLDPSNPAEERRLERLAQGQAEKELDDTPSADELATDDSRAREMASEATDGLIDDGSETRHYSEADYVSQDLKDQDFEENREEIDRIEMGDADGSSVATNTSPTTGDKSIDVIGSDSVETRELNTGDVDQETLDQAGETVDVMQ